MKALGVTFLVVTVSLAQVAVAPLFPVSAAVPDFVLVTLVMLAVFGGPTTVMLALPLMAICVGFDSDRAPGLVLMAYLPLLPVALFLEESRVPLNRFAQMTAAGVATGVWARSVLAFGAFASGAQSSLGTFLFGLLFAGLLVDLALLTVVYVPLRIFGRSTRAMTLQRSGW